MNLRPLIRKLKILDKNQQLVPFVPNWAQEQFYDAVHEQLNAGRPIRIIILKARQLGLSTATEALLFIKCMLDEGTHALVLAHETDPAKNLLQMSNRFWETYSFKPLYKKKYQSQSNLAWTNGSSMRITTASNIKSGRGSTVHGLHASECAFWQNPEKTMLSLRQTVPNNSNSVIVLESTANGVGNWFHKTWLEAEAGENEYIPLFFPWHNHPEYTASELHIPFDNLGALDAEEKALRAMGLSDDRLAWRRWAIRNLCQGDVNSFKQEYPSTPDEAFIQSGTNVFPLEKVRAAYVPKRGAIGRIHQDHNTGRLEFIADSTGPLTVFKWPAKASDWGQYVISGDSTRTMRQDYSCAQVINRRTLEQVAIWRGKIDPQSFGQELARLGKYYGWALLAPEMEGAGYATIGTLSGLNYPNIYQHTRLEHIQGKPQEVWGWSTNVKSKHMAIGVLLKFLVDEVLTIHDRETYNEMSNYVTLENGSYGPGSAGDHDDTVSALSIAVAVHYIDSSTLLPYGQGEPSTKEDFSPQPTLKEVIADIENSPQWESWGEQSSA